MHRACHTKSVFLITSTSKSRDGYLDYVIDDYTLDAFTVPKNAGRETIGVKGGLECSSVRLGDSSGLYQPVSWQLIGLSFVPIHIQLS